MGRPKPRVIKRSHADKLARHRALESLLKIRRLKAKGASSNEAVMRVTSKRVVTQIGARPFLTTKNEKRLMAKAGRAFFPSREGRIPPSGKDRVAKRALVQKLFGARPKLGLIVVGPELYHQAGEISKYLRRIGFTPALSKTAVLNKSEFSSVYFPTTAYSKKYFSFPVFAATRTSGPSKVIVFRWPSKTEVSAFVRSVGAEDKMSNPSKALKAHLRERFAVENLKQHGLWSKEGRKGAMAKALDSTGFIEKHEMEGKSLLTLLDGVHSPDAGELERNVMALLSLADLKKLERVSQN